MLLQNLSIEELLKLEKQQKEDIKKEYEVHKENQEEKKKEIIKRLQEGEKLSKS